MTVRFVESFLRDLRRLRDRRLRDRVAKAIEQAEDALSVDELAQFKWLTGQTGYGRIRVGDWRLGSIVEGDVITFVRCLHRRDVYRYFP